MLNFESWLLFLTAAFVLAFAPGPGMLYVLSRTISGGKSAGMASTLGTAIGGIIHVFAAALGISAILATSAVAFSIIKWVGACFLIYLGLKMLYSAFKGRELVIPSTNNSIREFHLVFVQGIMAEVFNPKTAIFFLAFIPQFIQPEDGLVFGQFLLLGMVVVLLNTIPDFLIAWFSKPVEKLWKSSRRFRVAQQMIAGCCLMGLGVYLALSGSNKTIHSTS